jgi:uncharacterized membrane protein YphA (DoxX/SURF4 family)
VKSVQTTLPREKGRPRSWHPASAVIVRVLIGGTLLYSGLQKAGRTGDLARIIYGYRLLHPELVNLAAITLPWLELLTGTLLLLGLLRRSSAVVACGLFASFTVAVGLAMARGIDAPCGCFSLAPGSERIGWSVLLRDGVLALLAACLVGHSSRFAELDALLEKAGRPSVAPGAMSEAVTTPQEPSGHG